MSAVTIDEIGTFVLPCAPASGERICVIGDIHGRSDLFAPLLDRATELLAEKQGRLVLLGDLIDRGPDSLGCLDLAIAAGKRMTLMALMGNHEQMMAICLRSLILNCTIDWSVWLRNGGKTVMSELRQLLSRNMDTMDDMREAVGAERLAYLRDLKVFHRDGPLLFVHAGVPWGVREQGLREQGALERFLSPDLYEPLSYLGEDWHPLWVREPHLRRPYDLDGKGGKRPRYGLFVVHGHTPQPLDVPLKKQIAWDRLNCDAGSWKTGRVRMAVIDGARVTIIEVAAMDPADG
jgi:serine/threonine protein phosphatase 1